MSDTVDLLIVGGGINGVGIARDAVGRGYSVLLVEKDDLAAHTSSASTKLIHGGLRYLEYYEFRLVRESLIERERLLGIAPHIIRPMTFVLPHDSSVAERPAWMVRCGLFLYDHLARRRKLHGWKRVRLRSVPAGVLLAPRFTTGFTYADCWVEDSRLVVLNAVDAAERGAVIQVGSRFLGAEPAGREWRARLTSADGERTVGARAIVNAAGPWVDEVLRHRLGRAGAGKPRLVKGSHIVVPRLWEGSEAFMFQNPDRRIVFCIPYEGAFSLIGTTDLPFSGDPDSVCITAEEVAYLCDSVNRYVIRPIAASDVVWTYSGVRPLYDDDTDNVSAVTRDYVLELQGGKDIPVLLSVFGGKLTTYRRLAEHALEKLAGPLGHRGSPWTKDQALPGGDIPDGDIARFAAALTRDFPFLAPPTALRLARSYGTRSHRLLGQAKRPEDLGEDFGGGLWAAEIDYLVRHEWARTAQDILWRRTKLGLHLSTETAKRVAAYLMK